MKILVGTTNKAKIKGITDSFSKYYKNIIVEGTKVESNVSDQPFNNEILEGAQNRINNLKKEYNNKEIDYYVAVEAGIIQIFNSYININLVLIEDKYGNTNIGTSSGYKIPDKYIEEIKEKSLGIFMDKILNKTNLSTNKGGISILTNNQITRENLIEDACTLALIKFINKDIWQD